MILLVSIVIPTYNTAEYISQTLDSIFEQTYKDYETIVVDDGSTDNTRDVLDPYMDQIHYIYQENRGRSEARNTGIKAALGKYVAFLDSDDLWPPGKLERQIEILEGDGDIDFLFGDKQRFSNDGSIIIGSMFREKGYGESFFGDSVYVRDPYKKLLDEPYIPTGTVIMKKEFFEKTGLFDRNIYAEDWEFWLRVALFGKMAYAEELWELERDRPGSGSKNLKAVYTSNIMTLEKHEREYGPLLQELGVDINSKLQLAYKNFGYFLLKSEKILAREYFKKSMSRKFDVRALSYLIFSFLPSFAIQAV